MTMMYLGKEGHEQQCQTQSHYGEDNDVSCQGIKRNWQKYNGRWWTLNPRRRKIIAMVVVDDCKMIELGVSNFLSKKTNSGAYVLN